MSYVSVFFHMLVAVIGKRGLRWCISPVSYYMIIVLSSFNAFIFTLYFVGLLVKSFPSVSMYFFPFHLLASYFCFSCVKLNLTKKFGY